MASGQVAGDAAALKAQIHGKWHIDVVDHDLAATIVPLIPARGQPVVLTDISAGNEPVCLQSVIAALSVYPNALVTRLVSKLVLADDINAFPIRIGDSQVPGLMAINRDDARAAGRFDEITVHNNLAGLVPAKYNPDLTPWRALSPAGFAYGDINSVKAEPRDPQGRAGDDALHRNGFVTRIALTDVTNDFESFAGQVFGHPAETVALLEPDILILTHSLSF